MSESESPTLALAIAGGALAESLLDALHEKGILDLAEARGVLDKAIRRVGPLVKQPGGYGATQIISDMLKTKYSARS